MNNIRQVALATHNYESAHGRFPPGHVGNAATGNENGLEPQRVGLLCFLLPYMELGNVATQVEVQLDVNSLGDDGNGVGVWENFDPTGTAQLNTRLASQIKISTFKCPSDQIEAFAVLLGMAAVGKDQTGAEIFWNDIRPTFDDEFNLSFGTTSYTGVSGVVGDILGPRNLWSTHKPILGNRTKTTFGNISDGSSNTFLIGEIATQNTSWLGADGNGGGYSWLGNINMPMWYWGNPSTSGSVTLRGFASNHSGIVNFAYADGSVRSVSESAEQLTMRNLAGMSDGTVTSLE